MAVLVFHMLNEYIDIFSFATSQHDERITYFYLDHLSLLKRFIVYFRFKSESILARKSALSFFAQYEFEVTKIKIYLVLIQKICQNLKIKFFLLYQYHVAQKNTQQGNVTGKEEELFDAFLAGKILKL